MAIIQWQDTIACLEVTRTADGVYTAPGIPMEYRRIFGGQLLAQIVAVSEVSAESKQVKSLHVVFPREGDLSKRVDFEVDALHDGRSFATRALRVHQDGRVIAQATVSLHAPETSALSHQAVRGPKIDPEAAAPIELGMIPWDTRAVGGVDLECRDEGPPESAYLMRTPPLEPGHVAHRALLAHATDLTLIGTALRPHAGLSELDAPARVITAVTSHSLWIHDEVRLDEWWLLSQASPVMRGARAFGRGDVFDADGRLVASFAQESLVRPVA